jgi:hypothetical protein
MSNLKENNSNNSTTKEQGSGVDTVNRLLKGVRNILKQRPLEEARSLGSLIIESNKDVGRFSRKQLWKGNYHEFMADNKKMPISVIDGELNDGDSFAFRAVSGNEFENIIASDGIGGEDYKGTVITDGTLFALSLHAPLAMMDGRSYGGEDDRNTGGYIIVVKKDDVITNSDSSPSMEVVKVEKKIPLDKLHSVFRIDRKAPTYQTEEDMDYQYIISKIILKPVK